MVCVYFALLVNSTFICLCSPLLHDLNTGATWTLHCIVYRDNLALHGDGQQQRFISCIFFLLRLLGASQTSQGSRIMIQPLYYEHMYSFLIVNGIVLSVLVRFSMYPLRFMYCKPTYCSWHYWAAFF